MKKTKFIKKQQGNATNISPEIVKITLYASFYREFLTKSIQKYEKLLFLPGMENSRTN